MNKANIDRSAEECSRRAQNLPESVQFALISVLPNIPNGAFWGFTSVSECKKFASALKTDPNIKLKKIGSSANDVNVLVEVNPDYLIKATKMISDKLVTDKDIMEMREGIATGAASLEKFAIKHAVKGTPQIIGIYCINDTSAITLKGESHPAFRVCLSTALNKLAEWGYSIAYNGGYVSASQALQLGDKLFSSMIMSPSTTGIFIKVAGTLTEAQLKQLKVQKGLIKGTK